MQKVVMYRTATCPYCVRADRLLRQKGVTEIDEIRVDVHPERRAEMQQKCGRHTVPQIWIGETHVGGCDDLFALDIAGRLDALLQGPAQ